MVEFHSQTLDTVFHALSDPTRRGMLRSLERKDLTVSELAAPYSMSLAAASKHIKMLEQAGLIRRRVQGRTHHCSLEAAPLAGAMEWLRHYQRYWTARLDDLERELNRPETTEKKGAGHE